MRETQGYKAYANAATTNGRTSPAANKWRSRTSCTCRTRAVRWPRSTWVRWHVDMEIADVVTGMPQAQAGKPRALGVSSSRRLRNVPNLPTIDEVGLKSYELMFRSLPAM